MSQNSCKICRSEAGAIAATGFGSPYSTKRFSLRECSGCGHVQTEPFPEEAELAAVYDSAYSYEAHAAIAPEKRRRARRLLRAIERESGSLAGKKLLEVGSMFGDLLHEAKRMGADARGIELSSAAVKIGVANGESIECRSAESLIADTDWRAEVIVLSHLLEHLAEPAELLTALRQSASASCVLAASVPNRRARLARLLGRSWAWWQPPVHLHHFDAEGLGDLLRRSDYSIISTSYACGDSLMFVLSGLNLLGLAPRPGAARELGRAIRFCLRSASIAVTALSPLLSLFCNDELTILARPDQTKAGR